MILPLIIGPFLMPVLILPLLLLAVPLHKYLSVVWVFPPLIKALMALGALFLAHFELILLHFGHNLITLHGPRHHLHTFNGPFRSGKTSGVNVVAHLFGISIWHHLHHFRIPDALPARQSLKSFALHGPRTQGLWPCAHALPSAMPYTYTAQGLLAKPFGLCLTRTRTRGRAKGPDLQAQGP